MRAPAAAIASANRTTSLLNSSRNTSSRSLRKLPPQLFAGREPALSLILSARASISSHKRPSSLAYHRLTPRCFNLMPTSAPHPTGAARSNVSASSCQQSLSRQTALSFTTISAFGLQPRSSGHETQAAKRSSATPASSTSTGNSHCSPAACIAVASVLRHSRSSSRLHLQASSVPSALELPCQQPTTPAAPH